MHDGTFLGLQGVHRAEIIGLAPDGRAQVLIPSLGQTPPHCPVSGARSGGLGRAGGGGHDDGRRAADPGAGPAARPGGRGGWERLLIEARREMTLRCGKASITMTADGRVTIRGTPVLSRSDGPNRVQGASVQLN